MRSSAKSPTQPLRWAFQVKVISAPSPVSEMISFQHTADLAGRASLYEYDWRIMPPVDGQGRVGPRSYCGFRRPVGVGRRWGDRDGGHQ